MFMDLKHLENALRERSLTLNEIDFYISYAKKLKDNNVPVIFDLEHLRLLMNLRKEDFQKIYYKIEYQYHYKYIPKNKIKTKNLRHNSKVKNFKLKINTKLKDKLANHLYSIDSNPLLKNKCLNKVILDYFHENTSLYRKLSLPSKKLKYIQRWILDNILYNISVHEAAHGFVPKKSTITNAIEHIGQEFVFKTDLKDFFPSITSKRVYGLFKSMGYNKSVAFALTKFCTYQNELPQGAPTSPYISNLICRKLDFRLKKLCENHLLKYSRYADDITISGGRKLKPVIPLIKDIIVSEDFYLNNEKTRIIHSSCRQKVTGVIVNRKASIPKDFYKNIRQELYYMNKFGVSSHLKIKNLNHKSNVKSHYYGLVHYCNMIDVELGKKLYKQLEQINWNS